MTTTTVQPPVQYQAAPAAPTLSPRAEAVKRIRAETDCSLDDAIDAMKLVDTIVGGCRANEGLFYPSDEQLQSTAYDIFDQVIPHGQTSIEGSAHQAIEATVLDPARGEYALVHEERFAEGRTHCTMRTCIHTVS